MRSVRKWRKSWRSSHLLLRPRAPSRKPHGERPYGAPAGRAALVAIRQADLALGPDGLADLGQLGVACRDGARPARSACRNCPASRADPWAERRRSWPARWRRHPPARGRHAGAPSASRAPSASISSSLNISGGSMKPVAARSRRRPRHRYARRRPSGSRCRGRACAATRRSPRRAPSRSPDDDVGAGLG